MLIVLIFVIPGWLVHNYEVLQVSIPFVTDAAGVKTCSGFW